MNLPQARLLISGPSRRRALNQSASLTVACKTGSLGLLAATDATEGCERDRTACCGRLLGAAAHLRRVDVELLAVCSSTSSIVTCPIPQHTMLADHAVGQLRRR
jgi:hypothetical protein